jgi:hypothetical protein
MTVRKTRGRILHFRSDDDDASADIEPANLVDGPQQAGTGHVPIPAVTPMVLLVAARSACGYVAFNRAILASLV